MSKKWVPRKIIAVEALDDYSLLCTFDDSTVKRFEMTQLIKRKGEMIEPLKKKSFFKNVFLEMGTPTWPNGYDVCPDLVYRNSVTILKKDIKKKAA